LDQIAALRWVQQNIVAFGADPDKVTIAGESEGSISVCAHLHIPESQGLFHRAILESGSCSKGPWGWELDWRYGEAVAPAYLKAVGAEDLEGLRQIPMEMLLSTRLFRTLRPSPDGWFMPRDPSQLQMLTKGIDVIIGSNTMDAVNSVTPPFGNANPVTTAATYASTVGSYFGADGLDLYAVPENASAETASNSFRRLTADACATCPKMWLAQKLLAAGNTVYMYNFGFYAKAPLQGLACHSCEVQDTLDLPPPENLSADWLAQENLVLEPFFVQAYDKDLAAAMSGYWVSFTKSGRPQGKVGWPKYHGSAADAQSLDISTDAAGKPWIRVERGLAAPQCAFFEQFVDENTLHKWLFSDFCFFNASAPLPSSNHSVLV
jgi:para-nitrobenzyl esterase